MAKKKFKDVIALLSSIQDKPVALFAVVVVALCCTMAAAMGVAFMALWVLKEHL